MSDLDKARVELEKRKAAIQVVKHSILFLMFLYGMCFSIHITNEVNAWWMVPTDLIEGLFMLGFGKLSCHSMDDLNYLNK